MTGGCYDVKVDCTNNNADLIHATGNITLGNTAILSVTSLNLVNNQVPAGLTRTIITSANGTTLNGNFDIRNSSLGAWTGHSDNVNGAGIYYLTS